MSTTPLFLNGQQGSATAVNAATSNLIAQGNAILTSLMNDQTETLINYQRKLTILNSQRAQANRVQPPQNVVEFPVCDFNSIDQTQTTGTVRIDTAVATLLERTTPSLAVIQTMTFAASSGSVTQLSAASISQKTSDGSMYQIYCPDGSIPTGTFLMKLAAPLTMTLLVIDISALLSQPTITMAASADGINFVPATVERNGYRLTGLIPATEVRYIQVTMSPTHSDTSGSNTFTLGITDFYSSATTYQMASEFVSQPVLFSPQSGSAQMVADVDEALTYFLSLATPGAVSQFNEVIPNTLFDVPGIASVSAPGIAISAAGLLAFQLPESYLANTLQVTDTGTGLPVPVVPGLSAADPNISHLAGSYIGIAADGVSLYYISAQLSTSLAKTFNLSLLTGPAQLEAQLKIQFITQDRATSPTFHGAVLQEI